MQYPKATYFGHTRPSSGNTYVRSTNNERNDIRVVRSALGLLT
jgi:hypothetical protein